MSQEITRGEAGRLAEQVTGLVYLCQNHGEWPIAIFLSEGHVIAWMKQNPGAKVWQYEVAPKARVELHSPDPYLRVVTENVP